ncbi:MAG: hypothetical protein PHH48_07820 [Eubacteriales bacterium]|nr:hypothetical protein [Eubacteriales bacterium]
MLEKLKNLFFDRRRSEDEYNIVIQVLERMRQRNSMYLPLEPFNDQRAYDYNDLKRIPDLYWNLKRKNEELQKEVNKYKRQYREQVENFSVAFDTILDTVEKRYNTNRDDDK